MVHRTAKSGQRAGQPFWGCSAYPNCRGTRPLNTQPQTSQTSQTSQTGQTKR
jgi:ssDNA-binding Zn-finger/Zn-ribbon topoisomerase 1